MIRPPDEYRCERLVEPNPQSRPNNQTKRQQKKEDRQFIQALDLSRTYYFEEMNKAEIDELEDHKIMELHQEECKKRENEVSSILSKLKRLSKYDSKIMDILGIIEYIFNLYTNCYLDTHYIEPETNETLQKQLLQIRFTSEERDILNRIIKTE